MITRGQFWNRMLDELQAPKTIHTRRFGLAWMQTEGNGGRFNPFNTTLKMPGSTPLPGNDAGVQNYPSLNTGLEATRRTLTQTPGHGYELLLGKLRANASARELCEALIASDWGTEALILRVLDDVRDDYRTYADKPIVQ